MLDTLQIKGYVVTIDAMVTQVKIAEKNSEKETKEIRYYISNLSSDIELFSKSVREHWRIKIMHWHLYVTFKENSNKTIEETANKNMNIIRKWALLILKLLDMEKR